jgi:hypothetical protein
MDAAGVRELARRRHFVRQIGAREILRAVQWLNRHSADCRKLAFGGLHEIPFLSYTRPSRSRRVLKPTIFREYDIRGVADVVAEGSKAESAG